MRRRDGAGAQVRNPKHEIRNKSRIPKNQLTETRLPAFRSFGFWASCLFRISDLVLLTPGGQTVISIPRTGTSLIAALALCLATCFLAASTTPSTEKLNFF